MRDPTVMFRSSDYLELCIEPNKAIKPGFKNHRFTVGNVNEVTPFD